MRSSPQASWMFPHLHGSKQTRRPAWRRTHVTRPSPANFPAWPMRRFLPPPPRQRRRPGPLHFRSLLPSPSLSIHHRLASQANAILNARKPSTNRLLGYALPVTTHPHPHLGPPYQPSEASATPSTMSQQVSSQLHAAGIEEDKAYFLARYGVRGLQYGCILATPLYALQSLRRRQFNLRGLMRYNWVTPLVGASAGSALGYIQSSSLDGSRISAQTQKLRLDANRVRSDDLHLIGSVLGALLLPAIFLRRVGLINGLLGGAGLGGAIGLATHKVQSYQSGNKHFTSDLRQLRDEANRVVDKL
ncbi:hypothetical protein ACQY0O_004627 [Thecaphora frezii]